MSKLEELKAAADAAWDAWVAPAVAAYDAYVAVDAAYDDAAATEAAALWVAANAAYEKELKRCQNLKN